MNENWLYVFMYNFLSHLGEIKHITKYITHYKAFRLSLYNKIIYLVIYKTI